jgi:hypothetical protein
MKVENKQLILERKDCTNCNHGTIPTQIDCDKCNGTGNGPRGGKNGCKKCHGFGRDWDHVNRLTCPVCNGDYIHFKLETPYDHIHLSKEDIPVKVVRDYVSRTMSFAEQYLGMGLFSCVDYGRSQNQTDEEIIESAFHFEERGTYWTQGIKLVRNKDDLRVCDAVAVILGDQGYSVMPIFEEE